MCRRHYGIKRKEVLQYDRSDHWIYPHHLCYGPRFNANPLWKYQSETWHYANGFWRALIGLPAWVAAIMLLIGNYKGLLTAVAITIACMLIPVMKMSRDGVAKLKTVMLLLWASMGAYARVFLYLTVLGIPVCNWTHRAAEVGWEQTAQEFATKSRNTTPRPLLLRNFQLQQQYSRGALLPGA